MTPNPRPSLRDTVNAKCRECIYDNLSAGAWREQVAACTSACCPLFDVRPVPRECIRNGQMNPAKIAAVRAKLDARTGAASNRKAV